MNKNFVLLASVAVLVGCAQPTIIPLQSSFDASEAREMLKPGKNKISGSALVRQQGGGVVTCAGRKVHLVPATDYATERAMKLYDSVYEGYSTKNVTFKPQTPSEYLSLTKSDVCDPQGYFTFSDLNDGEYFITTAITWIIGNSTQGGALMKHVSLEGGETKKVVLTP